MPEQHLREMLEALHEELEHTRSADVDDESRSLLRGVMDDARTLLGEGAPQQEGAAPEPASLLEQLRESTREFEESHPTLAAAVNRVATALSNLGI